MTKNLFAVLIICFGLAIQLDAQTMKDTIYTYYTPVPAVIDGSDSDACWAKAQWRAIDQVWIPYGEVMKAGDFKGRFKVAWDVNYLYILAEIEDNMISDDHANPLDNYWNDDCLEFFIDEDRSKGNHLYNNDAFAYHVSIFYDAIDGGTGTAVNCRNNMSVVMDTIGQNLYQWELAVKMFNKNFSLNNPEASRVKLATSKLMGFSIAYCDNDETTSRENFIGSMVMQEATANDSYINADYFGPMLLVDPDNEWVSAPRIPISERHFSFFPNPVANRLTIQPAGTTEKKASLEIISIDGAVVLQTTLSGLQQQIDLSGLATGIYTLRITGDGYLQSEIFSKGQ